MAEAARQCELIKILEETSLKVQYPQVFIDNCIDDDALKILDNEGLQQLIPIVGHRMKIKAALKKWKLLNESLMNDSALQEIFDSEDINKNCAIGSQIISYEVQNGALICNSLSQTKNADAGSSIQEEDIISESLESIRKFTNCSNSSSSDGRAILAEGKRAEGLLKESDRKRLSQIIILHLLEKNPSRAISTCEFQNLAAQIQELFKQESSVVYYSPYEPATGNKGHKKNTSGKLYESYISCRRKLRSRGELPDDETSEEKLTWLQNSIDPWRMVEEYWRATATVRLKPIIVGEGKISEYFNTFPALTQPLGYTLLLHDFEILHQNKNDGLFSNIVLLREKIVRLARDKENTTRDKDIKKCILNYINLTEDADNETYTNVALILLAYVIGTCPTRKRGKQYWKPSRSEIRDGFITQVASEAEVYSVIESRRAKL
ncbi:unnamed protein product [Spodoptera exigua]|nr:unnamed protein product [Spodoptera exigua]